MKCIVTDAQKRFVFSEVAAPEPMRNEALIAVHAVSVNRGELRFAAAMKPGFRPGWDYAGVVLKAVSEKGPQVGTRVVGIRPDFGSWAERITANASDLAVIPEGVSSEVAAALPVAGLTALYALERAGGLVGKRVLITGASGGVGHFAYQLAKIAGAEVVGLSRSKEAAAFLRKLDAGQIVESADPQAAAPYGPFDLILESVGGQSLGQSVGVLAPNGLCVAFGVTAGKTTEIDVLDFYRQGRRLEGFGVFLELMAGKPATDGLTRLLRLVAQGRLHVQLGAVENWTEVSTIAEKLQARAYGGKAVLKVGA
jgi:NADPH:quinone reductase